jgi:hypothetical protein
MSTTGKGKGKGKVYSRTSHEGPRGVDYSSTLSLTSTLDESGWSTSRPGRFTAGKVTRYPLYRRLGGVWTGMENLAPPGFDPRTLQPVASRYTDYAVPVPALQLVWTF